MVNHDRRGELLDSYENAAVIVSGIDAADLGQPTPCRKYDVADEAGDGWSALARQLNAEGVPTAHGGTKWYPSTVRAVDMSAAAVA